MLGHKTRLNKFKRIENILSSFSDDNVINLELSYSKKYGKRTNTWRQDNMLLESKGLNEEIKERIRKYLKTEKKWNQNSPKSIRSKKKKKSIPKRKCYSVTGLLKETRKISNKQPKVPP